MFMGTIFVNCPCEDNTRQIMNMLGQGLQIYKLGQNILRLFDVLLSETNHDY